MGVRDFLLGATEKQRARRAEKIRARFGTHPGMTPQMLEVLSAANSTPEDAQVEMYIEAVPEKSTPLRVSVAMDLHSARYQLVVLFPDGLAMLYRPMTAPKKGESPRTMGAILPFRGVENVEIRRSRNDGMLVVSGSTGTEPYALGYVSADLPELESLLADITAARRAHEAHRATLPRVTIDSSLPPGEQLAAIDQMRQMGAIPDDATYEAMIRHVGER